MEAPHPALFRIEGRFDMPAALDLRDRTMGASTPSLILDFSHVGQLDDCTLSLLSINLMMLSRRGFTVSLLGLRQHQCRMLAHFGVDVTVDGLVRVPRPS